MASTKKVFGFSAPVTIAAGENDQTTPTFSVVAYTGGPIEIAGWEMPVVVDMDGLQFGKSVIANLDHNPQLRVGHVTSRTVEGGQLILAGAISAATPSSKEVIDNAKGGFPWQASIEAKPTNVVAIPKGKTATVNGRILAGPFYHIKASVLKGFAFVSHGADENTTVSIVASATGEKKEKEMRAEVLAWAKSMISNLDVETLTAEDVAAWEAQYDGLQAKKLDLTAKADDIKAEEQRQNAIADEAVKACANRPEDAEHIKAMASEAIEKKWTLANFRIQSLTAKIPPPRTPSAGKRKDGMNNRILEAAICQAGRLDGHEKQYTDQELQSAHDMFKGAIGLKQLFLMCAADNGYKDLNGGCSGEVNLDVQRAAFGMLAPQIKAEFSVLSIPTILSNTANKFLRDGWNAVDQTPLRIAAIRNVRDFKTITTVSLTGDLQYNLLPPSGEIKHGTLGEKTYTNKADTYAQMLAITRTDIINDDLGALTAVPRRLGRGAMLSLNDIFWTEFLNNSSFFHSNYSNVNTGVADMTIGGLEATETIFLSLTDPNSKPLGIMPQILLVPTALRAAAMTLMASELVIDGSSTARQGNANIYRGRFRVESSPYMHNTSYTGYSAAAWYMLADPAEMPVIEIAALNGRVEPIVETADAEFNVLGVQMRGYSDVGVNLQEVRGGVRADGGSS